MQKEAYEKAEMQKNDVHKRLMSQWPNKPDILMWILHSQRKLCWRQMLLMRQIFLWQTAVQISMRMPGLTIRGHGRL